MRYVLHDEILSLIGEIYELGIAYQDEDEERIKKFFSMIYLAIHDLEIQIYDEHNIDTMDQ